MKTYVHLKISLLILLRMRNVSYKMSRDNQNTNFIFNAFFLFNRIGYDIM
jgi:hypothetical protein